MSDEHGETGGNIDREIDSNIRNRKEWRLVNFLKNGNLNSAEMVLKGYYSGGQRNRRRCHIGQIVSVPHTFPDTGCFFRQSRACGGL